MIDSASPSQDKAKALSDAYDCVVVGGGPAGSTCAALVAEAGFRTLQLEREKMPRFHVGESLMPETYWTLQRLGVLDRMRQEAFVRKVGVQFVSHSSRESQPFYFDRHDPRESSRTWHVERARFDQLLFENASDKGAECRDQMRVVDVRLGQGPPHRIVVQDSDSHRYELAAQVVVDATGQSALLANRLGLREDNPHLRKASIWTYYRGAERCADPEKNTTVILHTNDKRAWFWYIPLAHDVVSVGVVADNDYLLKGGRSPQGTFAEQLAKCPAVQRRIEHAKRVDPFRVAKEFSYTTRQHSGDGWVLVGDAFGFIDPIYSSGVFLALKSGELAADAIAQGLREGNLCADQLGRWVDGFERGSQWIRKLVHAFYTDGFSFGKFMKAHPEHQGRLTDLLIGRVFDDRQVAPLFVDLDPILAGRKQMPG